MRSSAEMGNLNLGDQRAVDSKSQGYNEGALTRAPNTPDSSARWHKGREVGFLRPVHLPGGAPGQQHPEVVHSIAPTALGTLRRTKLISPTDLDQFY